MLNHYANSLSIENIPAAPPSAFTNSLVFMENTKFACCAPSCWYAGVISGLDRSQATGVFMAATGELIRLINYVDDITTTLRRISASVPGMEADEKKRLAEHLRSAGTNFTALLDRLEKGTS